MIARIRRGAADDAATRYRTNRQDDRLFHRRNGVGRSGDKSTSDTANASGPARAPPRRKCAATDEIARATARSSWPSGGCGADWRRLSRRSSRRRARATWPPRLVVDRLLPAPRDRRISFALRPIACADDAIKASADILAAVARGRITPAEAEAVAKLLHNFIAASEVREFERRLEALEAASARRR